MKGILTGIAISLCSTSILAQAILSERPLYEKNTIIESSLTDAVDTASKSVVEILSVHSGDLQEPLKGGSGSGVIYKRKGSTLYVVTNYHVIKEAKSIKVTLPGGKELPGTLVGSDELTDLAVLTFRFSDPLPPIKIGNSSLIKRGEPVLAIGNPLGRFPGSVTSGIISSVGRTIVQDVNEDGVTDWNTDVIQTDTAINPGNSGGALVNAKGQWIGINSLKIAKESVEGIGFAIPVNAALPILKEIEKHGKVERPVLGITMLNLDRVSESQRKELLNLPDTVSSGVVITEIGDKTPASKHLKVHDVITEIEGQAIQNESDLRKVLYQQNVDQFIDVTAFRNGEKKTFSILLFESTLTVLPAEKPE